MNTPETQPPSAPATGSLLHKGLLWAAINRYAKACGGNPGSRIYGNTERQLAAVEIEALVYPPNTKASDDTPKA